MKYVINKVRKLHLHSTCWSVL